MIFGFQILTDDRQKNCTRSCRNGIQSVDKIRGLNKQTIEPAINLLWIVQIQSNANSYHLTLWIKYIGEYGRSIFTKNASTLLIFNKIEGEYFSVNDFYVMFQYLYF